MEVIRESSILRWMRRVKQLVKFGIFMTLCASFVLLLLILYLRSQPLPEATINQTTTLYAQGGEVLDTLHRGENRIVVPLNKIAPSLVQATIASEDRGFFQHYGFDLKRLAKVVYINVTNMDKLQGASTITQQLARNLYLTMDKTWERKIKEAILAVQLELNYSKEEILEMYMNQIYYGESAYGAQAAAQTYFGKDADQLTLAESATLAAFPKGPSIYDPYDHFDKVKTRQKLILQAMQTEGIITAEQADAAYREKLTFRDKSAQKQVRYAPYYRDYISSLVKNKYGIDEERFLHGGLKIYTT
ncbi:MAG: transglycosylase domain-containing protein, partial [Clostridia bacterium]